MPRRPPTPSNHSTALPRVAFVSKCVLFMVFLCETACDRSPTAGSAESRPNDENAVVIYCSVDVAFAQPILDGWQKRTGVTVHRVFDTEAGKTTGLIHKLLAERNVPRADVWWSGELFGTLELAESGVLDSYAPTGAEDIPAKYRDAEHRWTAIGLRGRVLAFDPSRTRRDDVPRRWRDLADPKYKDRFRMADPRFGTTRGHMAALTALWGEPAMREFYRGLRANGCVLTDGNSQSVLHVTRGLADFGATDTDDVLVAQKQGVTLDMIHPSLDPPRVGKPVPGTLWIPASVACVKNGPHPAAARRLVDYLVSEDVESLLYASDSRNVPVRPALRARLKAELPSCADVDYAAIARALRLSDRLVAEELLK